MLRRTKIVATLGPSTDDPKMLDSIIQAGVDVVRINFSHGNSEDHIRRVESVRNRARAHGRQVGVLVDLQGPKIRISRFREGYVDLKEGEDFTLDIHCDAHDGDEKRVGLVYKELCQDVKRGDTLLLDDGRLILWVHDVVQGRIECRVVVGGKLSDSKGINLQGGGLSADALTEKDIADIKIAAEIDTDYLAVSFPRTAEDIMRARRLLAEHGCQCGIVAKIERAEALDNLEDIIRASDVVMIARGDLGVEIGDAKLPFVQKRIIKTARTLNKVVITATQMMESMIENPIPTRAEVFDVANAVLDGSDAVMLSGETAMGKYPDKAISSMDRICREVEKDRSISTSAHRLHEEFHRVDESIAMASMYTANHLGVKVIAALTESGSTTLWMSRISSGIPIYAMTRHLRTRRKVTLYRGVYPCSFDASCFSPEEINREAVDELLRRGAVREGDLMIITNGNMSGEMGGTDTMRIIRVGESQVL